jgi:O-methyltransferase involved in polyketide biosynthesis
MTQRDFNTISPSAKSILLMKAETDIPFAKDAAALITDQESAEQLLAQRNNRTFIPRVMHFENRYKSIDVMLEEESTTNIIELSSGFSFRGLAMAVDKSVHYIDTDLPAMINMKLAMIEHIKQLHHLTLKGHLLVKPLNVLEEDDFLNLINRFPAGAVTIVNEGLLVYLNDEEKRKLCDIIKKILEARGGSWITGDIYIRSEQMDRLYMQEQNERTRKFFEIHNINENKFEDFNAAASFFESCGFRITSKKTTVPERLSSLKLLSAEMLAKMRESPHPNTRETWRLGL